MREPFVELGGVVATPAEPVEAPPVQTRVRLPREPFVELEETDLNLRNLLIIYIFSNYCFPIGLRF